MTLNELRQKLEEHLKFLHAELENTPTFNDRARNATSYAILSTSLALEETHKVIAATNARWLELQNEYKQVHDPRYIFEVKGREQELSSILGENPKLGNRPEPSGW